MTQILVLVVLAALAVAAYHFREPLLAAIKKKFGKKEDAPILSKPYVVDPNPVLDPVKAYQDQLPASTRAFLQKGKDPEPQGPVDHSGNDLSDGGVRIFVLANGQKQTVTFNRPGSLRVFGSSGTQLKSVTDTETRKVSGTIGTYERIFSQAGSYTFSVESVGGNIAVQLR